MLALSRLKHLHFIQKLHTINAVFGLLTLALLIATARLIKIFISNGSALAGFGNYNMFSYPATYVYMLIPVICSFIYSIILAADPSPQYAAWKPSKTLIASMASFVFFLFLAALLPAVPGADVIFTPDSALSCTWVDFMSWRTIYNAPELYPWITSIDTACQCLRAADAFTWILMSIWAALVLVYLRIARRAPLIAIAEKKSVNSDTKTEVA